jgi:polyhydroxybutyrate depolymerase
MPLFLLLLFSVAAEPQRVTFTVEGAQREALMVVPDKIPESGAPLVFVFHGHGGTSRHSARRMNMHAHWPDAIVVYPQGIPGVPGITDKEGKRSGWQKNPGEVGDRDIKFFDVMLEQLTKKYRIDANRIYAMGHSNGSRFVNVLWNRRGEKFAAFCSSGGQGGLLLSKVQPKPVFVIAGEKDPLVPYAGQMRSVELIRKLLAVETSKKTTEGYYHHEPGKDGLELASYLHPGGHEFPEETLPHIAAFFQKHVRKQETAGRP